MNSSKLDNVFDLGK